MAAASALALVLAAAGSAQAADPAMRIAVLEFAAAGGDAELASLGKGLQSMITTDLAQIDRFTLVERARLSELEKELKLARSGLVDKKTAVKLGKLAGATHLLSGSFTVVGEQMRLDAQLFAVKDGKVALAEKIEGEREAFFELEKELVRKLVGALGVKLAPKERASLGKVHTADFEAFRQFSRGVAAFDAERWDDALAALREASRRDADFALAKVTLAEYERIIGRLRSRADEILAAKKELERLEKLKERDTEAAVVGRLFAIAQGKDPRLQLAATLALAVAYAPLGSNRGRLLTLRGSEDRFAMQRTADAMVRAYYAAATARFPAVPVLPSDRLIGRMPEQPDEVDAWVAKLAQRLEEEGADYPDNRKNLMLNSLRWPVPVAERLGLDVAGAAAMTERLYEQGLKLGADAFWRDEQRELLVKLFRRTLALDRATKLLAAWSGETDNAHKLKGFASELEKNRDLAAILEGATRHRAEVAEFVRGNVERLAIKTMKRMVDELFSGERLGAAALAELARTRQVANDDFVLLGDHPVWPLQGHFWMVTGPRTDARRAQGLRYYREATREPFDALAIVDGTPRERLTARFRLEATPPKGWWPRGKSAKGADSLADLGLTRERPAAAFLFGVSDVDCAPKDRPMKGHAVVFTPEAVRLVRFTESARGSFGRKTAWQEVVLGERRLSWGSRPLEVEVAVRGAEVTVKAGGETLKVKAPEAGSGFYGFRFGGEGYVGVEALEVKP